MLESFSGFFNFLSLSRAEKDGRPENDGAGEMYDGRRLGKIEGWIASDRRVLFSREA
jgi:hypothetical protein